MNEADPCGTFARFEARAEFRGWVPEAARAGVRYAITQEAPGCGLRWAEVHAVDSGCGAHYSGGCFYDEMHADGERAAIYAARGARLRSAIIVEWLERQEAGAEARLIDVGGDAAMAARGW